MSSMAMKKRKRKTIITVSIIVAAVVVGVALILLYTPVGEKAGVGAVQSRQIDENKEEVFFPYTGTGIYGVTYDPNSLQWIPISENTDMGFFEVIDSDDAIKSKFEVESLTTAGGKPFVFYGRHWSRTNEWLYMFRANGSWWVRRSPISEAYIQPQAMVDILISLSN